MPGSTLESDSARSRAARRVASVLKPGQARFPLGRSFLVAVSKGPAVQTVVAKWIVVDWLRIKYEQTSQKINIVTIRNEILHFSFGGLWNRPAIDLLPSYWVRQEATTPARRVVFSFLRMPSAGVFERYTSHAQPHGDPAGSALQG